MTVIQDIKYIFRKFHSIFKNFRILEYLQNIYLYFHFYISPLGTHNKYCRWSPNTNAFGIKRSTNYETI